MIPLPLRLATPGFARRRSAYAHSHNMDAAEENDSALKCSVDETRHAFRHKETRHAAGSNFNAEKLSPVVSGVMSVVVANSGIRGNDRTGQNRECNQGEQHVTDHLHRNKPLWDPAALPSDRFR